MNVTDEMVEAAAKAMHDGPLGADDEAEYTSDTSNKAAEWCREMARAALQAALSLPSPPVGEIAEGGGETERLVRAKQWLQDRWSEKHPNTAHIRQLADYETFLRALSAAPASPANGWQFRDHLRRQREWSEKTFGPGPCTKGVVDHIRKELSEIEADPADILEWIDVAILALDGAWRAGFSPDQIIDALIAKQTRNEGRAWPDWRTASPDHAIEHVRPTPPNGVGMNGLTEVPAQPALHRTWAMPSPQTFTIKPIAAVIERHMMHNSAWIDPFCRQSTFKDRCIFTNDLNPAFAGTHNMDALEFLKLFPSKTFDGVLFDPPFSPRQAKEEYSGFGALADLDTSRRFYSIRKREAARVLKIGGVAIVCGWNSLGLGKKNGMAIEEVHLINHGDQNDTIVTVCRKTSDPFEAEAGREALRALEGQQ